MLREKQQLLNGFFWQCSGYVMEVGIYESRLGSQEKQNMMPQHPNQNLIFQLVKPPQHLCPMLKHPSLKKKRGGCPDEHPQHVVLDQVKLVWATTTAYQKKINSE